MPILDRGIWVSSSLWLSMRQSQWLEPKHCAGCRARTVSLRCSRIGFPMGMLGPLPGTAGCWGQLPSALNETLLPAAPSKGTSLPGRALAESLAGVPVPLRSVNACNGASVPVGASLPAGMSVTARGVTLQQGTVSVRDTDPSLRVPSAPVWALGPWQGCQPQGCRSQPWSPSGRGRSRGIHANRSPSAINRCDKQPATGDIMKVRACKRRTDNNAVGNYRAALYWISAVQNELRLAGHASPLLECLLLLSFVIVSGSSGGWMRGGHVSSPHLFCITMQPWPPAADPECQCPPPKWTKKTVKTQFTWELGRLSLKQGCPWNHAEQRRVSCKK